MVYYIKKICKAMKILHVSLTDAEGGAAIAMQRLHQQLLKNRVESLILTMNKKTADTTVLCVPDLYNSRDKIHRFFNKVIHRVTKQQYKSHIYSVLQRIDFDVLHLHWIEDYYGDMLSWVDLKTIRKPIVVSLHDCVTFTGGCHYCYDCLGIYKKCINCPLKICHNTAQTNYLLKEKMYSVLKPYFIAPSKWMQTIARKSHLLSNHRVDFIPHGIDTSVFRIIPKDIARESLGYKTDDLILLAGAVSITEKRKGMSDLPVILSQIKLLYPHKNVRMLCFGKATIKLEGIEYVGMKSDVNEMVLLYSAADVMLVPSRQEAFGLTTEEAMACGTPVVIYKETGMEDMIVCGENGYVAEKENINDFVHGVKLCIDNPNYGLNARNRIETHFTAEQMAYNYIQLYKQIIGK